MYAGPTSLCEDHFTKLGSPLELHENPADHFMARAALRPACCYSRSEEESLHAACSLLLRPLGLAAARGVSLASVRPLASEPVCGLTEPLPHRSGVAQDAMASEEVTQKLLEAYTAPDVNLEMCSEYPISSTRNVVGWPTQFVTCLGRVLKDQWRNRDMLYLNLFQACAVSFFIGLTFLKMGQTNASQVKRRNLLFLVSLNQGVCGAFLAINTFPPERALMLRERANGMYRASAYYVAKQFGDFGQIICPWVFSCICYYMVRAQLDATCPRRACEASEAPTVRWASRLACERRGGFHTPAVLLSTDRAEQLLGVEVLHFRGVHDARQHVRRLARHGGEPRTSSPLPCGRRRAGPLASAHIGI